MSYSMKEVCRMLNLPSSTIRYYDKEGLLPFVERTEGGYRQFSESDVGLLKIIECLKRTGMPIKDIRQFTLWVQQGDASLQARYEMFLERKKAVQKQMEQLQETMKVIDHKCWYYRPRSKPEPSACIRGRKRSGALSNTLRASSLVGW